MRMVKTEAEEAMEEGVYTGKLTGIQEQDGKFGAYLRWTFSIQDDEGDYDERTVSGQTPAKLSDGSKTDKWIKNLLGEDLGVGEEIDLDDLIGKKGKLVIKNNTKGDREFSNVTDVLPLKRKSKKTKSDDDEEDAPEEKPAKKEKPAKEEKSAKKEKSSNDDEDGDDDFNFDD